MEIKELERITCLSCDIVEKVGEFIREELGKVSNNEIEKKSYNSLVSYVDKTAEEKLVKGLQGILPGATFLTEEETISAEEGEYRWIIDPLDGTTNFLHQLPHFAISVALQHKDQMILGIVYDVTKQESFYAWKNGGAFLNGEKISVSQKKETANALVATGFPYHNYDRIQPYFETLEYFMRNSVGIRRLGSAAVDLAYVACGRFDLYFEYTLNLYDIAGGVVLVQEAGGVVTDFAGGDNYLSGAEVLAANPAVYKQSLPILTKCFHNC